MAWPHLFEFMDQDWLPSSLRGTLREILEVGCSRPFRPYYEWVAAEALAAARETGCQRVVELGAGPAPVTKVMAPDPASDGLQLIVSDRNPDRPEYEALEKKWPGKVEARYDPVDISVPQNWEPGTLVFLSALLHHIPPAKRPQVLKSLTASATASWCSSRSDAPCCWCCSFSLRWCRPCCCRCGSLAARGVLGVSCGAGCCPLRRSCSGGRGSSPACGCGPIASGAGIVTWTRPPCDRP